MIPEIRVNNIGVGNVGIGDVMLMMSSLLTSDNKSCGSDMGVNLLMLPIDPPVVVQVGNLLLNGRVC